MAPLLDSLAGAWLIGPALLGVQATAARHDLYVLYLVADLLLEDGVGQEHKPSVQAWGWVSSPVLLGWKTLDSVASIGVLSLWAVVPGSSQPPAGPFAYLPPIVPFDHHLTTFWVLY